MYILSCETNLWKEYYNYKINISAIMHESTFFKSFAYCLILYMYRL